MEYLFKAGLGSVITERRDDLLLIDPVYKEKVRLYTKAMDIYEQMDVPEEIRTAVHDYIVALEGMNQRCEYACYLAGVVDSLIVADYLITSCGKE